MAFNIKKWIPKTYYDVEPCPNCGDICTGRYLPVRPLNDKWSEEEALRHGEIVKQVDTIPTKNLFCIKCGHEWKGEARFKIISLKEMEEIIEAKRLYEANRQLKEDKKEQKKNRSVGEKIIDSLWM